MTESSSFQLRMTPGELYYAAGVLGVEQISLIGQPFAGWKPEKVQEQVLRGKQLLEECGLIRPSTSNKVEVDETLAFLIQLAAKPSFLVEVSARSRTVKGGTELICPIPGGFFVISTDGPDYLFSTFAQGAYDPFCLLKRVGINQQIPQGTAPTSVEERTFWSLARHVFNDKLPIDRIRTLYQNERKWIDGYLPCLEFIATLALRQWVDDGLKVSATRVYVGNSSDVWQAAPEEASSHLEFYPVSAEQIFTTNFFGQL